MIKKEVLEIRKHFAKDKSILTRIAGCYVNGQKEKVTVFKEAFYAIPEEESFKYFEIFKKALSGTMEKNLINLEFDKEAEWIGPVDGDREAMMEKPQGLLQQLRVTKLQDDDVLDRFYDQIIEKYAMVENYLILLTHGVYDVPGRTTDGIEMEDASDEVYEYVLCSLCPVKQADAGLSYDAAEQRFHNRQRDWLVSMPEHSFLYPLFNDRSSDIHGVLYYSRNAELLFEDFIAQMLGCHAPVPAGEQKETFQTLVSEVLQEECTYETVKNIHENLAQRIEAAKEAPEPLVLDKAEMRSLMLQSGVDGEKVQEMERRMDDQGEDKLPTLMAGNVAAVRKMEIRTPSVVIQVSPEYADMVETKVIDGRKCLVIGIDDNVTINGIEVKA